MLSRKLALLTATLLISTAPLEGVARSKAHSQKQAAGGDTVPVLNGTVHAAGDAAGTVHDFNALLDQVAGSGRVAGLAVAVVKDKEVLLQRGIGYADMSSGAPVTPDTVFRLASLSAGSVGPVSSVCYSV